MAKIHDYFCFKVKPDPKKLAIEIERAEIEDALNHYQNKAYWKRCEDEVCYWYECSNCGQEPLFTRYKQEIHSNYCPNCGCRMLEKGEDDDVSD